MQTNRVRACTGSSYSFHFCWIPHIDQTVEGNKMQKYEKIEKIGEGNIFESNFLLVLTIRMNKSMSKLRQQYSVECTEEANQSEPNPYKIANENFKSEREYAQTNMTDILLMP